MLLGCQKEYLIPTNCAIFSIENSNKSYSFIRNSENRYTTIQSNNGTTQIRYYKDSITYFNTSSYNNNSEVLYKIDRTNGYIVEKLRASYTKDSFVSNFYFLKENKIYKQILMSTNGIDTFDKLNYNYNLDKTLNSIQSSDSQTGTFYSYYEDEINLFDFGKFDILCAYFGLDLKEKLIKSRMQINLSTNDTSIINYTYIKDSSNRIIKYISSENIKDTFLVKYKCDL